MKLHSSTGCNFFKKEAQAQVFFFVNFVNFFLPLERAIWTGSNLDQQDDFNQKQPPRRFLSKRCFENMQQI